MARIPSLFRGQLDNARLLREAAQVAGIVSKQYGIGRLAAFRNAVTCTRSTGMRPHEALQYGVLAPDGRSPNEMLSKRVCSQLQKRQNTQDWFFVVEDKGIFHQFCLAAGIPVPHCHALLFRDAYGTADNVPVAPSLGAWSEALATLDPTEAVIKPCRSSYGRGLLILKEHNGELVYGPHRFANTSAVAGFMYAHANHRSWLVQRRIHAHPSLEALSGTPYLQTVRIYTHVEDDGTPRVAEAFLKVIGGDAIIDNFQHGTLGNFIAPIDLDSGRLEAAISRRPDYRWTRLANHPRTGRAFQAFHVPQWQQTLETMRQAAACFRPLRSLSWDVAITEAGPVIIETNIRWDPPNWNVDSIQRLRPLIDPRVGRAAAAPTPTPGATASLNRGPPGCQPCSRQPSPRTDLPPPSGLPRSGTICRSHPP